MCYINISLTITKGGLPLFHLSQYTVHTHTSGETKGVYHAFILTLYSECLIRCCLNAALKHLKQVHLIMSRATIYQCHMF